MKLKLKLGDVDFQLEIRNWMDPTTSEDGCGNWTSSTFKLKGRYIDYYTDDHEILLSTEVVYLRDKLGALLNRTLEDDCRLRFAEPDWEFELFTAKRLYDQPGKVAYRDGYKDVDCSMIMYVHFWCREGGLSGNTFCMQFGRKEIQSFYTYLRIITGDVRPANGNVTHELLHGGIWPSDRKDPNTPGIELNTELYEILRSRPVDYEKAENLLKMGARANGAVYTYDMKDNLFTSITGDICFNDNPPRGTISPEDYYKITKLLVKYGLDISRPDIPYDHNDILHPFEDISTYCGEYILRTLKYLLDHGLTGYDASFCWEYALDTIQKNYFASREDKDEFLIDFTQKVLLFASYPRILDLEKELPEVIWYKYNRTDPTRFRDWNAFTYIVKKETFNRDKEYINADFVTVIDKQTGETVWHYCPAHKRDQS